MLGVLYDIHGNLPALEAVLADARSRGATRWLLGGDYAAFGAWPRETVARLEDLEEATWIRGNWDRWLGGERDDMPEGDPVEGAALHALEALDGATLNALGALPAQHREQAALFCHGSPRGDMDFFLPQRVPEDAERLRDVHAMRVVFGHTHLQFHRSTPDGVELLNPGSVGLPFDGDPRAAYALIAEDGAVSLHRVGYDHASAVGALRALGEPWAETIAGRLAAAR